MINLDKIEGRRIAVHIPTREKRMIFFNSMKERYPDRVGTDGDYFFDMYNNDSGFCYFPRFGENRKMTYGRRDTYDDWGVPVIEFDDLMFDIELDTNISHMSIESLFD